jgi:drug/metabolite transporter (DMT)-like permease
MRTPGRYGTGIILMVSSTMFFSVMSGLIAFASNIDSYKTALFRFIIGIALLGTAALSGKIKLVFTNGPVLFLRGLFGGGAVFIFFLSIAKLGVAKGSVISCSFPIFASIAGIFLLKEKVGVKKWLSILASFIGIYLISFSGKAGALHLDTYEALAVFGAVLSGFAVCFVKKLHDTDSSYAIFFHSAPLVSGWWSFRPTSSPARSVIRAASFCSASGSPRPSDSCL